MWVYGHQLAGWLVSWHCHPGRSWSCGRYVYDGGLNALGFIGYPQISSPSNANRSISQWREVWNCVGCLTLLLNGRRLYKDIYIYIYILHAALALISWYIHIYWFINTSWNSSRSDVLSFTTSEVYSASRVDDFDVHKIPRRRSINKKK